MNAVEAAVPVVVGVDGGGSKTDAVALTLDGTIVGRGRGAGSSPHYVGVPASVAVVDAAVREAIGAHPVVHAGVYLSGLDLPPELDVYRAALAPHAWAADSVVDNDLWALLRAGTESPDAVAIVCGTGINAVGIRADGATARFAALGAISGDWGGGSGLGEEALWHAARAEDGRGPATALRDAVLEAMDASRISEVIEQLHFGRRSISDLIVLAPAVLAAARAGDHVAITLVDRQAEEVVSYVRACLTRLELLDHEVPVVLGGGLIRSGDTRLLDGIAAALARDAPLARTRIVDAAPLIGAGLLALESAGATADALGRARAALDDLES